VKSYVLLHHQVVTAMPHGSTKPGWPPRDVDRKRSRAGSPAGRRNPIIGEPARRLLPAWGSKRFIASQTQANRAGALDLPLSRRDNVFVERLGVTESLNVGAMVALIFLFLNLIEPYRGPLTPTHAINSDTSIGEGPIGVSNLDTLCLSRLCAS
jgi:hypothetical protein